MSAVGLRGLRRCALLLVAALLLLPACGGKSVAEKHYEAATKLMNQGQVSAALEEYSRSIMANPALAAPYLGRAIAYDRIGNSEHAIADLDKAIQMSPRDQRLYVNRGVVYMHRGENQQAVKDFDEAVRLAPKDPVSYANRALAYTGLGKTAEAQADFDTAVKLGFDANVLQADMEQAKKRSGQ